MNEDELKQQYTTVSDETLIKKCITLFERFHNVFERGQYSFYGCRDRGKLKRHLSRHKRRDF